jgi:hypothetical protein
VRQAEFFHSLWDDPGGAVAKEELLWRSGSRRTTGMSVAYATASATTCCAAGARAVGTTLGEAIMGLVVGWPRKRMGQAGCRLAARDMREMARGPRRWMGQQMVGEVARGLSLFGGASSEVRRCNCSVVD